MSAVFGVLFLAAVITGLLFIGRALVADAVHHLTRKDLP